MPPRSQGSLTRVPRRLAPVKIQKQTKEARAFEVENNFRAATQKLPDKSERLRQSSMQARGYDEDD